MSRSSAYQCSKTTRVFLANFQIVLRSSEGASEVICCTHAVIDAQVARTLGMLV